MSRGAVRDMTEGSPTKLIVGFFLPMLLGLLFQQVYNMVDTIVVGKFLGVEALAGVGSTGSLNFLVLGFCMGVCNGFVIPVAQKFGERDYPGMKRFVTNAIMLSMAFAAVMTTLVCTLCSTFLRWMNTPADIFQYAYDYIFIIFLGIPVVFLYNVFFGIIRSLGDSRTPVIYLIFSSLLNVALDVLFILGFNLGVKGAALATVTSQMVSSALCINYVFRSDALYLQKKDWKISGECIKRLLGMGLPTGMQYSITALGAIVLQTAVNGLGSMAVASIATGVKVSQLLMCPFDAMGSTMATYGGQNVGARKLDRVSKGLRSCSIMGSAYAIFAFLVVLFFSRPLTLMFVDASETEVLANARTYLLINASMYVALAFVNIVRFLIQGLGFSNLAVFAGVFEMLARAAVAFTLVPMLGFLGACFANPTAWIAADLFLFPAYFHVMRKLRKQFAQEEQIEAV
ncbi:MAG: MATE family efflux transporter [Clostridiales bacterium]|nr:MATE family efflux transporter [Clostridiales bacterium]